MLKRYFFAGVLFWAPLWVTWLVIDFLVGLMDRSLSFLPQAYQPDTLFGFHVPGLGLIFTVIIVFLTGVLVTNFFGRRLVQLWERLLTRIPLVRSIYGGVKQVTDTVLSPSGQSFRKVLLIEYPRAGLWTIAFQTNNGFIEAEQKLQQELITVFVPTTPNPTAGFFLLVPKASAVELSLTVDEALKMVISMGVVMPPPVISLH